MAEAPSTVTATFPVGVEVESRPGKTRWASRVWRPVALRPGRRNIPDWTMLPGAEGDEEGAVRFYAGTARLVIRSTETALYRDNIGAREPAVYVVLRRSNGPIGWTLLLVTVDPSEAHAHVDVGDDLVEALPMPASLREWLAAFVARHHVERLHWKRQRDDKVPDRSSPPEDRGGETRLGRWSREKRAARAGSESPPASPPTLSAHAVDTPAPPPRLPALEDIRTRDDVAAFLREGVPSELRLAALRRAWRLDPAIATHSPLVDYDWNVNAPGYGRLRPTDDPARLIEALFGHLRKAVEEEPVEEQDEDRAPVPETGPVAASAAEEPPALDQQLGRTRRHGGATPGGGA
jgi:hypothetical protein